MYSKILVSYACCYGWGISGGHFRQIPYFIEYGCEVNKINMNRYEKTVSILILSCLKAMQNEVWKRGRKIKVMIYTRECVN